MIKPLITSGLAMPNLPTAFAEYIFSNLVPCLSLLANPELVTQFTTPSRVSDLIEAMRTHLSLSSNPLANLVIIAEFAIANRPSDWIEA